jgi:hypothetical protein
MTITMAIAAIATQIAMMEDILFTPRFLGCVW